MPPYNFPAEQLTPTANLKISQPAQETPARKSEPAKPKPNPLDPFAHWPSEMLYLVNRYPEIRFALLEALEKETKLGNLPR